MVENGSYLVTGGTQGSDGQQLFHSFQDFNIAAGSGVYFTASPSVKAILTRVVGNNPSEILGVLGTKGTTADLFLLNPNGISFGADARLDLRGSFFASTSGAIATRSGEQFSAIAPQSIPLLRLNLASGLQYGQPLGELRNAGNLQVDPGQRLTLLGGRLEQRGRLAAPGGEIRVLGDRLFLLDQATVDVSGDRTGAAAGDGGRAWIGGGLRGGGDVPLARQVVVGPDVQVLADGVGAGSGGEVIVWSKAQTQFWGEVSARGGALSGDGGFVEVSSAGDLRFGGQADTQAPRGQVGTLLLDPTNIEVVGNNFVFTGLADVDEFADVDIAAGGSQISANTIRNANSNVVLQATEGIRFNTDVEIRQAGVGLTAQAGQLIEVNGSLTTGKGGELVLIAGDAGNGPVPGQGEIVVAGPAGGTFFVRSDSGDMRLVAGNTIQLDNAQLSTSAFRSGGGGSSGDLFLDASQVNIGPDSVVTTNAFTPGDAGNITINAQNVQLNGGAIEALLLHSELATPGRISITADRILLDSNAAIAANSRGAGPAGNIDLFAEQISLAGQSRILAAPEGSGDGGTILLDVGALSLSERSTIGAASVGSGDSGEIVFRGDSVTLADGSELLVSSSSLLQNGGNAGSIQLDVAGSVAVLSSNIAADAITGQGGDINISASSLIGEGASITSVSLEQPPGNIAITTQGDIDLDRGSIVSAVTLGAGDDNQGRIAIATQNGGSLSLNNRSAIFSGTSGPGNAGDITLNLDGDLVMDNESLLSSTGSSGDVAIYGRSLQLDNGSSINTATFSAAGLSLSQLFPGAEVLPDAEISIPAEVLEDLNNSSGSQNDGRSGNLTIRIDDAVTLGNSSALLTTGLGQNAGGSLSLTAQTLDVNQRSFVASLGQGGSAGNINLTLLDALTLNQGVVSASSEEGSGGNIAIASPDVLLDDNSAITSSVFDNTGGGGAINIQADRFVIIGDSDILANAEAGPGGSVRINSETFLQGLFDQGRVEAIGRNPGSFAAFRGNGRNDISADSFSGTDGTVDFPQIQPERRTSVPLEPILASEDSIDRSCAPRPRTQVFEQADGQSDEQSAESPRKQLPEEQFIVSGRGGIPLSPKETLSLQQRFSAWVELPEQTALNSTPRFIAPPALSQSVVVEASNWQQRSDGRIRLVSVDPLARVPGFAAKVACLPRSKIEAKS